MKTKAIFSLIFLFSYYLLSAQVPQGFNYQAIARDGTGNLITETFNIKVEIQNLAADTIFWIEEHSVTPNEYGLISFVVGQSGRTGGTSMNFSDIDWTSRPRYLQTWADQGSGYELMGTSQIWSVPYSLVSKDVTGPIGKLGIKGTTEEMDEALFEVKNNDGQIIFAVYNQGVRIYVDDAPGKGVKGGFAIGGFGTEKGTSQPYLIVKPDTVRIYINQSGKGVKGGFAIGGYGIDKAEPQNFLFISDDSVRIYVDNEDDDYPKGVKGGFAIGGYGTAKEKPQDLFMVSNDSVRVYIDKAEVDKGKKGGFAIGGFGATKGMEEEYLRVTRDSTRVYVNESAKASSGGFAIGGLGAVPGNVTPFTSLTPDNYFIGHRSGIKNTSGIRNSFVGYETGVENDTGSYNVFLGYKAGYGSVSSYNTFIGYQSGAMNTTGKYNAFMGYKSGLNNKTGNNNVYIGYLTGNGLPVGSSGSRNVCLGNYAGYRISSGSQNVFIGNESGSWVSEGWQNVFIGDSAGSRSGGGGGVYIGYGALGKGFEDWGDNIVIGRLAGYDFWGGSSVVIGSGSAEYGSAFKSVLIGREVGRYSGHINNDLHTRYSQTDLIFIGYEAGYSNLGDNNIFIGTSAGYWNGANNNIFIGNNSGFYSSGNDDLSGCSNTFIGHNSGFTNGNGKNNTGIGYEAGYSLHGDGNVYIGYQAGYSATGSNKLYIANSSASPPLIYGDFSSGYVGIGTEEPSQFLDINGNGRFRAVGSGAFAYDLNIMSDGTLTTATSDISMKENIEPISDALGRVIRMNGVYFNWKGDAAGARQIGMIAQEVESVVPEIVFTNPVDGLKGINYSQAAALLVEALKEQQQQIESYKSHLQSLQEKVDKMEALLIMVMEE